MHSREARDKMTERVEVAFWQWPSFEAMPEVAGGDARALVKHTPDEFGDMVITQMSYVQALWALAYQDVEPVGRQGDFVIGKDVD